MDNRNNEKKGLLVCICVCFVAIFLMLNFFLYLCISDRADLDSGDIVLAVCGVTLDVAVLICLPNIIKDIMNSARKKHYKKKQEIAINTYEANINLLKSELNELIALREESDKCVDFLELLTKVDETYGSQALLQRYYEIANKRLQNKLINSTVYNRDIDNHSITIEEIEKRKDYIEDRLNVLQRTLDNIKTDLYNEKEITKLVRGLDKKEHKKLKNIDVKRMFKKIFIILFVIIIFSVVIALSIFYSSDNAIKEAEKNYLEMYNAQEIIKNEYLSDIMVTNEQFSEFEELSTKKEKFIFYTFNATSSDISKYYTQEEDSCEAKALLSIMRKIYGSFEDNEYKYTHNNGWTINVQYHISEPLSITDSNGIVYSYWNNGEDFEYLEINGTYVIYNI